MIPTTTDLPGTYISTVPLFDTPTVRAAALTAAEHAHDTDEARIFLAQLGLCGQQLRPQVVPLACGHPSTEGTRHGTRKGVVCRACSQERDRTRNDQKDAA